MTKLLAAFISTMIASISGSAYAGNIYCTGEVTEIHDQSGRVYIRFCEGSTGRCDKDVLVAEHNSVRRDTSLKIALAALMSGKRVGLGYNDSATSCGRAKPTNVFRIYIVK